VASVLSNRVQKRARQGDGQLVLIVGEPGLGKSRLIEEFHGRLRDTPHTWLEWSCSQLLQNTPLHPIAEWGRQVFGGADVSAKRRFADLESTLAQMKLDPAENAPLLAPLLDIPLPLERAPTLAPDELRRRQLVGLRRECAAVRRRTRPEPHSFGPGSMPLPDRFALDEFAFPVRLPPYRSSLALPRPLAQVFHASLFPGLLPGVTNLILCPPDAEWPWADPWDTGLESAGRTGCHASKLRSERAGEQL
jgi:hypothetical protein